MNESEKTTLHSIRNAAKAEFLERGYQSASLRTIAARAGVTTGALYGYFKNKEELFDALVGEAYHHILDLYREILDRLTDLSHKERRGDMAGEIRQGMMTMQSYMYRHHDAFKLLLCCAEGTKYVHMVHEMAQLNVEATHDFTRAAGGTGESVHGLNPTLEHMLASGMFAAFFELIVHDVPEEQAETYIDQMLAFYAAGWTKVLGL